MWSKNAIGRPGNGVSVQAKLNSPKPTPSQGCGAISASVFDQIAKRESDSVAAAAEARLAAEGLLAAGAPTRGHGPRAPRRASGAQQQQRPGGARQAPVEQTPECKHHHAERPVRDALSTTTNDEQHADAAIRRSGDSDPRLAEPDHRDASTTAAGCSGGWAGAGCRWRGRRSDRRRSSCRRPARREHLDQADDAAGDAGDDEADAEGAEGGVAEPRARRRGTDRDDEHGGERACPATTATATTARAAHRRCAERGEHAGCASAPSRAGRRGERGTARTRQSGASTSRKPPQPTNAAAWLKNVADGATLKAISVGRRPRGRPAGPVAAVAEREDRGAVAWPPGSEKAVERQVAQHVAGLAEHGHTSLPGRRPAGNRAVDFCRVQLRRRLGLRLGRLLGIVSQQHRRSDCERSTARDLRLVRRVTPERRSLRHVDA